MQWWECTLCPGVVGASWGVSSCPPVICSTPMKLNCTDTTALQCTVHNEKRPLGHPDLSPWSTSCRQFTPSANPKKDNSRKYVKSIIWNNQYSRHFRSVASVKSVSRGRVSWYQSEGNESLIWGKIYPFFLLNGKVYFWSNGGVNPLGQADQIKDTSFNSFSKSL